jgi:putative DNA primase/helicase
MQGLNVPLEEFLRPFFDIGETVCLRVFTDRKDTPFKGLKLECAAGKIESMTDTLKKHNAQNRGIFFVVNYGGHEDSDITRINAQFVECDDASIEEQLKSIDAFQLPPSIIVKTRKSLHTYWLMKNAEIPRFRTIQKALIQQFDGDKTCVNESRVMRLPGFEHRKAEPIIVECVKFNPELLYTQDELVAVLPNVEEAKPAFVEKGKQKGLSLVLKRCDFLKHCQDNAATLPEHDWYAMITNLAVFDGGEQAIHILSQSYPNYNHAETQAKIVHFMDSGTKPMTCRTIAEKGFVCPRMEACGCKAPASLAYKPLSVEELRAELQSCEVKRNPVDDIGTATTFVTDHLYNIEPVVAESFINYEMKDYFGLKAGDMKPLIALHKNIYHQYTQSKETKREQFGDDLPAWYEPTDHGLRFLSGLLADHMAKNVDAFYGAGSYFFYGDGVYHMSEDLLALAKVREFMIPRYASMVAINDTVGQWRMLIHKPVREINCNAFIINVRNGLYNVLDGSFQPHTPAYFGTVQISATYDPDAKCPAFLSFLHSILDLSLIHISEPTRRS